MKSWMKKILSIGLLCSSFFVFVISCTGIKNILGWSKPLDSKDLTVSQFISNIRHHQGNPDSHYLLACYYQDRGRHKEAIEEFKKVLSIDPGYVKAYNGLGVSYDLLGDFTRAIEFYKMALKLNPDLDYVYNNLGYSYLLQGNIDDSIAALKTAIVINGQDHRTHNNLGLAYGEKGQYDLALAEFKLANDEAEAHQNMAQIYFKKGLLEEAKTHYAMALKLNPSLTVVRTALKAADTLAKIFEPIPTKVEPKQLVTPQPPVKKEEIEKSVAAYDPPFEKSQLREPMPSGQLVPITFKEKELITIEQTENNNEVAAKQEVPSLPNSVSKPVDLQKSDPKDNEGFYELQLASFRIEENAIHSAKSVQESGFDTEILTGGNGNKDRWYRLIMGPFETKDEAIKYKVKIEKEYHFSPTLKKAVVRQSESQEILTSKPISEKEMLLYLKEVDLEISNGNGVYRMARKVGDYLKEKGLKVTRLTNANNFNHSETKVFYRKEYREAADRVVKQIPVVKSTEQTENFDRPNIKIKILIGKDLMLHHKTFENGKKS